MEFVKSSDFIQIRFSFVIKVLFFLESFLVKFPKTKTLIAPESKFILIADKRDNILYIIYIIILIHLYYPYTRIFYSNL